MIKNNLVSIVIAVFGTIISVNIYFNVTHSAVRSIDQTNNVNNEANTHLDVCSTKGLFDSFSSQCRCFQCQKGSDCSIDYSPDECVLDATSANPVMYELFWATLSPDDGDNSIEIPHDWLIGHYTIEQNGDTTKDDKHYPSIELEKSIRNLHKVFHNADVDDHELVIGVGSTQLMHAALFALDKKIRLKGEESSNTTTLKVTSRAPYYDEHRDSAEFLPGLEWVSYYDDRKKEKDCTIEIITMPGNPDATLMDNLDSPCRFQVYDHAYYWPQYTPINSARKSDIMLFTLTKLSGHGGSRVGWSFVKDKDIAKYMRDFINFLGKGVSHESQIRASFIIDMISNKRNVTNTDGDNMALWAKKQMESRWKRVESVLKHTKRFEMKERIGPFQDSFFLQEERMATPSYLWMKCNWGRDLTLGDGSCQKFILDSVGLKGREGSMYGVSNDYVRFSLLGRSSEFEIFMTKLTGLIPLEIKVPVDLYSVVGLPPDKDFSAPHLSLLFAKEYPPRYVTGNLQFPSSDETALSNHLVTFDLGNSHQSILTVEGCQAFEPKLGQSHCPPVIPNSTGNNYTAESFCWKSHPEQFVSKSNFRFTGEDCPTGVDTVGYLNEKSVCRQCFGDQSHSRYTMSGVTKSFKLAGSEVKLLSEKVDDDTPSVQNFSFGALVFVEPIINRIWSNVGIGAHSQFLEQLPASAIMIDFDYYKSRDDEDGGRHDNIVFNPSYEVYKDWNKAPYTIESRRQKRTHTVTQILVGKNNTILPGDGVDFMIDTGNSGIALNDSVLREKLQEVTEGTWLGSSLLTKYTKENAPEIRIQMAPGIDVSIPGSVWVLSNPDLNLLESLEINLDIMKNEEPYIDVFRSELYTTSSALNPTIFKEYHKNVLGLPFLSAPGVKFVFDDDTKHLYSYHEKPNTRARPIESKVTVD